MIRVLYDLQSFDNDSIHRDDLNLVLFYVQEYPFSCRSNAEIELKKIVGDVNEPFRELKVLVILPLFLAPLFPSLRVPLFLLVDLLVIMGLICLHLCCDIMRNWSALLNF